MAASKHIRAIITLPVLVTIIIPGILLLFTGPVNIGWSLPFPLHLVPIKASLMLIGFGLVLMISTIRMVARIGEGTLAPWDPTHKLVVQGVYRHVRNPMISGVFCVLLGEAVLFGSLVVFGWFVLFLLANLVYIPGLEERDLEKRFWEAYRQYKRNVSR